MSERLSTRAYGVSTDGEIHVAEPQEGRGGAPIGAPEHPIDSVTAQCVGVGVAECETRDSLRPSNSPQPESPISKSPGTMKNHDSR